MKKGNLFFAGGFSVLAILVIIQSCFYPEGREGIPGPGFFPILIATLMLTATLSLIISSLKMKPEEDRPVVLASINNKRAYITMGIMVLYVFIMPFLGFCVTTFIMLFGMIRWLSHYKSRVCVLISAVVVALIFVIFRMVLNVSLNFGLLV